ncbi:MAG TPA: HAD-IIIA family hydrolase [Caldisericia bacterium]|nr:HAD-IIIA family hydrolase [Caldisericia bacterium]
MKTVIMAGGRGTRIAELNPNVPKPMIEICNRPVLEWQIDCLKKQNYTDIVIIIGYLGYFIKNFFEDGHHMGVSISYIEEQVPLGTAGSLYYLKQEIQNNFLLLNGDVFFNIDLMRFFNHHHKYGGLATIFTHPNDHPSDSSIVVSDSNCCVTKWLHKDDQRGWFKNQSNAGLHFLSPKALQTLTSATKLDLDQDVLKPMILKKQLFAYSSPEYVKDMGTPHRHKSIEIDLISGKVQKKNLQNKQKAIFLDRDGTINKYVGFLTKIDDFELIEGVAEMIREMNQSGYLVIVVTNQPVIARGEVSWAELGEIHNKMETLLGYHGAYVDDIFICPHHPHKGYPGENVIYKNDCDCRKPKPGLLLNAARKYNIDLRISFMVGDRNSDIDAGKKAGCLTYKVYTNQLPKRKFWD